jgi:hypothetical protein
MSMWSAVIAAVGPTCIWSMISHASRLTSQGRPRV